MRHHKSKQCLIQERLCHTHPQDDVLDGIRIRLNFVVVLAAFFLFEGLQ
ncbi:MAG: hypothetical protein LEGION0403_FIIPPAGN_00596 [Legionella sp.]